MTVSPDGAPAPALALDMGGLDGRGLAAEFGTPLYVYDLDVVACRVRALQAVLPPVFSLAYAVKANPSLAVVRHIASLGLGADVASRGELVAVLRAGFDARRVIVTGPGKGPDLHRAAVRAGVRAVTVESVGELERLERVASEEGRVAPVLLRAATVGDDSSERVRIIDDAGAGKFGMEPGDLRVAARHAVASPHLDLLGLHRFGASNVTDADVLLEGVARTVDMAGEVAAATGSPLRIVDVGGGLGIPYGDDEEVLDLGRLGAGLASMARRWAADPATAAMRVVIEPGRFLVGPAGAYLVRVADRKRVGGCEVAILDGGINHLLRPALVRQGHRVRVMSPASVTPVAGPVTLAGPLCTGLDVFASGLAIAAPSVGDLVAVLDAGAYGFTESMPLFLSHNTPAEVVLVDGRAHLVRPSIGPEEWLDRQSVPPSADA